MTDAADFSTVTYVDNLLNGVLKSLNSSNYTMPLFTGFAVCGPEGSGKTTVIESFVRKCTQTGFEYYRIDDYSEDALRKVYDQILSAAKRKPVVVWLEEADETAVRYIHRLKSSVSGHSVIVFTEARHFEELNGKARAMFIYLPLLPPADVDIERVISGASAGKSEDDIKRICRKAAGCNYHQLRSISTVLTLSVVSGVNNSQDDATDAYISAICSKKSGKKGSYSASAQSPGGYGGDYSDGEENEAPVQQDSASIFTQIESSSENDGFDKPVGLMSETVKEHRQLNPGEIHSNIDSANDILSRFKK